jgi:chaperonin GroES
MLKPLKDRVLVEPLPAEEMTKSGIVLPESAKEKPAEGKIVALGTGISTKEGKKIAFEVKVGDKVLYGKYAGDEIKIKGVEYKILKEDEILGIL